MEGQVNVDDLSCGSKKEVRSGGSWGWMGLGGFIIIWIIVLLLIIFFPPRWVMCNNNKCGNKREEGCEDECHEQEKCGPCGPRLDWGMIFIYSFFIAIIVSIIVAAIYAGGYNHGKKCYSQ